MLVMRKHLSKLLFERCSVDRTFVFEIIAPSIQLGLDMLQVCQLVFRQLDNMDLQVFA